MKRMPKTSTHKRTVSHTVAVSGAATFLGSRLIRALLTDRRNVKVVAIDSGNLNIKDPRLCILQIDITDSEAGVKLHELFNAHSVDTLVHTAFLSHPSHNGAKDHELHVIGTMHLLYAAAAANVRKIVVPGSTMAYGARVDNPLFLTEKDPLRGGEHEGYLRDLVEVERQLQDFSREHPRVIVTVLRMANLLGSHSESFFSRLLQRRLVPTIVGYDPLLQFLHEDDAVVALVLAVDKDAAGPFNIVAEDTLPLLTVLRLGGQASIPLLTPVAKNLGQMLWALRAVDLYPEFVDYLRYPCIADGQLARITFGFLPLRSGHDALLEFVRAKLFHRTTVAQMSQDLH